MSTAVVKCFLFATLSSVFICLLSCHKPDDVQQSLYIPISGKVYDTSLNKGVEGVWIFFGRRPPFSGIGNGPAYDYFDSLRTNSAGDYSYRLKYEDRWNYAVCPGIPPGYSYADEDCAIVFSRREHDTMVPLKMDFLLVR